MVNPCCAPGCNTGYKKKKKKTLEAETEESEVEKISLFKFPSDKDLKDKWVARVPRVKWQHTDNSRLCAKHFVPSDFQEERDDKTRGRTQKRGELARRRLKQDAIPSIWPNVPSHLSKETPPPRITEMASSSSREMMESLKEKQAHEKDTFSSLKELDDKFCLREITVDTIIRRENCIVFLSAKTEDKPEIKYCMKLSENLNYELWCDGLPIKLKSIENEIPNLPNKLNSFSLLVKILSVLDKMYEGKIRESVSEEELIEEAVVLLKNSRLSDNKKVAFLTEQLLLACRTPHKRRYSSSLLAMSVMWLKISPTAYRHIYQEGILTLPTERRLQQLTSSIDVDMNLGESTKSYLKARISRLAPKDLTVSLLIDEIYCSKKVEYSHGRFYGNENCDITKTLLCFMIKSVAGKYRDIVAMVPLSSLNAKKQYTIWYNTASALTEIGFDIVITMTDGNSVNHTFFKNICGGALKPFTNSPFSDTKMHLMFDPVHLFKCFYNNFVNKKHFLCPSYTTEGASLHASFEHLKEIYELELGKCVRMAYKLSDKMLHPTNIEKTNVSLADACFHESTINALRYYSQHGYSKFAETAEVLQIFRNWFNAVNVKSLYTGQRTIDANRKPIRKDDRSVLEGFQKFGQWLKTWESSGEVGLSKQTFTAAMQTTQGLIDVSNYLLDEKGLDYVLPGHMSDDYIEGRFSWYRQSSGANYSISVLQILQAEKTIRVRSLIDFGFKMSDLQNIFVHNEEGNADSVEVSTLSDLIHSFRFTESLDIPNDDQAIIYYVAGAIVRSIMKKLSSKKNCEKCRDLLTVGKMDETQIRIYEASSEIDMKEKEEFVAIASRGGLLKPSDLVYVTCVHAWSLYNEVKNNKEAFEFLLSSSCPRSVFTKLFMYILEDNSPMTDILNAKCAISHTFLTFAKSVVSTFFNVMAKNYVSDMNDKIHAGRKRTVSAKKHGSDAKKIKKLTSN